MAIIKKKTWPQYFKLIKAGKKKFELRLADFKIKPGDILVLEEYNPKTKKYTGQIIKKRVKFVLKLKLNRLYKIKELEKKGVYVIEI